MTDCPSCGAPLKDGDWTCGRCGAPVAGATRSAQGSAGPGGVPDPYGYAPGYEPRPAAPAAPVKKGASGTLLLVVILAVVALAAIIAVWFFVVRGAATTSGEEFLGSWTSTGGGISTVVVARPGDDFKVTLTGEQAAQKVTVPAHLDGDELVITVDDFATLAGEADADRFKDTLKALAGDFRIIFSSLGPARLQMRIEGTTASVDEAQSTVTLEKATP